MTDTKVSPGRNPTFDPECPNCESPLHFIEDEETGEQWWYCNNPDCDNLEHYDPDKVRIL
jgi:ssDNA-binding Zn-finger/Zn-ribbon topoisomerase 1